MKKTLFLVLLAFYCLNAQTTLTLDYSQPINVTDYGVVGDGVTNDHSKLQLIFDTIKDDLIANNSISAVVYFPRNTNGSIYLIDKALKIPPKCSLIGENGTYTLNDLYKKNFILDNHALPIIRMKTGCTGNMLESFELSKAAGSVFVEFQSAEINNLILDGNLSATCGISLNSTKKYDRPGTRFYNLLIYRVNGDGFFAGLHTAEYQIERVFAMHNEGNGFHFQGVIDIDFNTINGAGGNTKSGLYFEGTPTQWCGAINIYNFDSWGNKEYGINFEATAGVILRKFKVDKNYKSGIRLKESGDITMEHGFYSENSRASWQDNSPIQHSHLLLEGNNSSYRNGCFNVKIINNTFGQTSTGTVDQNKSKYAIEDNSYYTASGNEVNSCAFYPNTYTIAAANDNVFGYYTFSSGNLNNPYLDVKTNSSLYQMWPQNEKVTVDVSNAWKIVQLPRIASVHDNDTFTIQLEEHEANLENRIILQPYMDENGKDNVTINNYNLNYEFLSKNYGTFTVKKENSTNWKIADDKNTVTTSLSPFNILPPYKNIIISAHDGWKQVKLPLLSEVNDGQIYHITHDPLWYSTGNKIIVTPQGSDKLRGLSANYQINKKGITVQKENESNWLIVTELYKSNEISTFSKNIPKKFALKQNYPNPFNPTTNVSYEIPENEFVNIEVYNTLGEKVRTLVNENKSAGSYTIKFDASSLPSGIYIYRIKAGSFIETKKMILTK